jgi:DNA-binding transcriptional LysR family regulator
VNLKQLETFYWVVRLRSFAAAAEQMNAAQSTISMRIAELETSLGVVLLDRAHHSASPTRLGRNLFRYAEQIIGLTSEIRQQIADPSKRTGRVRLGVTEMVAVTWLPDLVAAIKNRHPAVVVELNVDLTRDQLDKLRNLDIDVALVPGPINLPEFSQVPIGAVEFAWMASPSLGIGDEVLTPAELQSWPLLLLTPQSFLNVVLGPWFGPSKARPRNVNFCNSVGAVVELAVAGLGVAYLPTRIYDQRVKAGQLKIVKTKPELPVLKYYAVYHQSDRNGFIATVAELAAQYSQFRTRN